MRTDHFKMLCDMGELNQLFTDTHDLNEFLNKIVETVSVHMHTAVCSIYLLNETSQTLSIAANKGLDQTQYKDVCLSVGEGLVGKTMHEGCPTCCQEASKSAGFKSIPGLKEELFDAFLAVPICQGTRKIGVLVIQRETEHPFDKSDIDALQAIASQLGNIISYVHMLMSVTTPPEETTTASSDIPPFIKGKSGSTGYAIAQSMCLKTESLFTYGDRICATQTRYTLDDFNAAVRETEQQLELLQRKVEETLSDVASLIFTAHLLMLKDASFIGEMRTRIENGMSPPEAIITVGKKYIDIFSASPAPLLQEKTQDITDLVMRLLRTLASDTTETEEYSDHIVIARELFPSDILKMASENIRGIVLISGGITSHVAILSRSLHIPLIMADREELLTVQNGTPMLLDAEQGNIYINPTDDVIETFEKQRNAYQKILADKEFLAQPTRTADGHDISLFANINLLSDLITAHESQSDGVGLYRTEFPFLIRADFPTEEEQYVIYKKLVDGMPGKPITFRTLDIGGDKLLSYYSLKEQNPFLGFRSIRFSLQHKEVFIQQIRAILRAGHNADIRIMFPMISSIDEFREAKAILDECKQALTLANIPHAHNPKIGIMIEIPSIVNILDDIAPEVDFFSVGTNDFIQFYLAVDRTNEKVASFYNPLHPAVTRALKNIADIAATHTKPVSICGDMAHDERCIAFLIGIGLTHFSIDPLYIPKIKRAISRLTYTDSQDIAHKIITEKTIRGIRNIVTAFFNEKP